MKQNMKRTIWALLFAVQLALPAIASAQGSDDLEDYTIRGEKQVAYGAPHTFLEWHGYLNFEFDKVQGKNSNFDLHEFYLSAQSNLSSRVSLTAEFEYEHAPEKLILPIQAFATLRLNPRLSMQVGNFYVPIGIPRTYTLRGNKNRLIRQVALTHDLVFENWATTGVNLYGDVPMGDQAAFFFDVAVGNGVPGTYAPGDSWFDSDESLQDHSEDNNGNKLVAAHVGFNFSSPSAGSASVGVSYATQKYDPTGVLQLNHFGVDVRYQHPSGPRLQFEWLRRSGDDNAADLANGYSADADGWYAQISHRMLRGHSDNVNYVEAVFMVDEIDLNRNAETNGDRRVYSLGFNYSPEPFFILKFEYDIVQEINGASLDNNAFWLSLVVEF